MCYKIVAFLVAQLFAIFLFSPSSFGFIPNSCYKMTDDEISLFTDSDYSEFLTARMASSEVDQKALGIFAATTALEDSFLSAMLYKVLGLSIMLSKKLLRARRLRRLDPTRETKSLLLYHRIIWLSREGLMILQEFVLPLVDVYVELKVLAYKLRASFYHVFVLFHNQPAIQRSGLASTGTPPGHKELEEPGSRFSFKSKPEILPVPYELASRWERKAAGRVTQRPPGLAPVQPIPMTASTFLLPAHDFTATATACFNQAATLAERMLPGSHPLRLSVKLEYAAYIYDCLHDPTASRRLAKQAIADVYNAQEGMDDESFEDAAEIVGILGRMVKRGGQPSSAGDASNATTRTGTPRGDKSRSDLSEKSSRTRRDTATTATTPTTAVASPRPEKQQLLSAVLPTAVPSPTMVNPI